MKMFFAACLLAVTGANAADYVVAPSGNDKADGITKPWATLVNAGPRLKPGDTLTIGAGDYSNWASALTVTVRGTAEAPVVIRGSAEFSRTSGGWAVIRDSSYVTVDGFTCRDMGGACIAIRNSDHVTVRRVRAYGNWRAIDAVATDDSTFEHLHIERNTEGVYIRAGSDRNTVQFSTFDGNGNGQAGDRCAICIGEASAGVGNRILHNHVTNSGGPAGDVAVIAYAAPETLIAWNTVTGNYQGGIWVTQGSRNSAIIGNVVTHNGRLLGESNQASVSVRNDSPGTLVLDNEIVSNRVSPGDRWGQTDERGALDIRRTTGVTLLRNIVYGTVNGPDVVLR
jgi:hypothetical protein